MPKRILTGRVVSDKMDKTGIIAVSNRLLHTKYKKYTTRTNKYQFHDEANECKIGDLVSVIECRPMSRNKNWRLLQVIEKAQ